MPEQNYTNHARYSPLYHIVLLVVTGAIVVLSIRNLFLGVNVSAILFLLIAIALLISFIVFRQFPLVAQDRAIRAEENLRYFTLTGHLFDNKLTMGQIIALRFASDGELVELTEKAINEKMSNREIKKAVKHWRADHHRA